METALQRTHLGTSSFGALGRMLAPNCADEVLDRTVRPREWTRVIEKASEAAVASLAPPEGAPVTGLESSMESMGSMDSRFSEESACETDIESSFSRHTVHGASNFAELFARQPQDANMRVDGAHWRMPMGLLHEAAHEAAHEPWKLERRMPGVRLTSTATG